MIPTSEEFEDPATSDFPTEWRTINDVLRVECRQLSVDTYQLRTPSHTLTLNKEGFDLYRDGSMAGQVVFDDWCQRNHIVAEPRILNTDDDD